MPQTANQQNGHPVHLDRNKAIIWARYLIDSAEWLIFATRVTLPGSGSGQLSGHITGQPTGQISGPVKLVSLSLLTPSGKVIFETMIKPQEMIPASLISEHGLDYSVVFNAQPFPEVFVKIHQLLDGKQILAWDLNAQQSLFDQLCGQFNQPVVPFAGYSLRQEYDRYIDELDSQTGGYKHQTLSGSGISATTECRAILNTLTTMASTSQTRDTAPTGHQGWTAELYKPKVKAKEKIKDFLGL